MYYEMFRLMMKFGMNLELFNSRIKNMKYQITQKLSTSRNVIEYKEGCSMGKVCNPSLHAHMRHVQKSYFMRTKY